jgi:Na+-driven multidrug efflux pump
MNNDHQITSGNSSNNDSRKKTFKRLLISQLLYVISLPIWFFIAYVSLFASDSPSYQREATILISIIWSYPIFVILTSIFMWVCYRIKKYRLSVYMTFLPLIPILLTILFFLVPGMFGLNP